jgi:hypothetical protein
MQVIYLNVGTREAAKKIGAKVSCEEGMNMNGRSRKNDDNAM